ncbi:MAG: amino acid adenylation domain-containing protein [Alcanivoracaceae bacterium]|nr:amino acid adenylation domain-containing protein [Alcanivoracaceae bacterium]
MNNNESSTMSLPNVTFRPQNAEGIKAKFDLVLNASPVYDQSVDNGLHCSFVYNTDLFKQETIVHFTDSLVLLFSAIVKDAHHSISALPILNDKERDHLIYTMNDTQRNDENDLCFHQLFEQQAHNTPNHHAVLFDSQFFTYTELNKKSNQLAHYLINQGYGKGKRVGILLERSTEMLIAVLAIMKSGASYVALEASHPDDRLAYVVKDAQISLIVLSSLLVPKIAPTHVPQLLMDEASIDQQWLVTYNGENPKLNISLNDEIYTLYTSGSTGLPKGVMITHKGISNYLQYAKNNYWNETTKASVVSSPLCFDATVTSLFTPLCHGGYVELLADSEEGLDILYERLLTSEDDLLFKMTPAHLEALSYAQDNAYSNRQHYIVVGGEQLALTTLKKWKDSLLPQSVFVNEYGPTETVVGCSVLTIKQSQDLTQISTAAVPIGLANSNTQFYVLDKYFQLQPKGSVGELYIGGHGVANGYINQRALNTASFIDNPFTSGRLYRTGDVVRYLEDDNLLFVGRANDQVKIRGFRIEPGEIEQQIINHKDVESSIIVVDNESKALVAYIISHSQQQESTIIDSLRLTLKSKLPEYMLPSAYVFIECFPLTANGKIDKKALPQPDYLTQSAQYVAPVTHEEFILVKIWANLLNIVADKISTEANFFELGGHSLLLTQMIHAIASQLDIQLQIKRIFEAPTIKQIAESINQKGASSQTRLKKIKSKGPKPLSYAQYRVWFIEQLKDHTNEHNMTSAAIVSGNFNPKIMQTALNIMIAQHEVLRTWIDVIENKPYQMIEPQYNYTLPIKDLRGLSLVEREEQTQQLSFQHDTQVFNLNQVPLLSALVIQTTDDEFLLHFNLHHIISDGWSQQLFYSQLMDTYDVLQKDVRREPMVAALNYSDYAYWQNEFLQSQQAHEQRQFWQQYLKGCNEHLSLPIENSQHDFNASQSHCSVVVTKDVRQQLKSLAHSYQGSLFHVLHSAFALLIARLSGENDFNIGLPVTGRHIYGTQDMLGMFLNNLPVRHQLDMSMSYAQLLQQQITNVNQVLSHQDIPFENILEITGCNRNPDSTPLFQILFNMLSLPETQQSAVNRNFKVKTRATAEIENKFNMTLYLTDTGDDVKINCHFNNALYDLEMIEQLLNQYTYLLAQIAENSDLNCTAYSLNTLPTVIEHDLPIQRYHGADVTALFHEQAILNPEATAIIDGDCNWSYQELLAASYEIASKLQVRNIGPGDIVTIMASRHASVVIAMMAVLQTGAAYSIVVATSPIYQITQHLNMVDASILLLCEADDAYSAELLATLCDLLDTFEVSNHRSSYTSDLPSFIAHVNQPQQRACITFTSGSSGIPKAIVGTHAGLSGYLQWWPQAFNITAKDRFSLLSGLSHDPLQRDIFSSLCVGACLVIPSEQDFTAYQFSDWLKKQQVSVMHLTPAMAEVMAIEGISQTESIKAILLTGEALRADTIQSLRGFNSSVRLFNCYGASESQRAATYYQIPKDDTSFALCPIAVDTVDTRLRIVNAQGLACGVGELGEIIIESAQLAQGYLNDSKLTAQCFVDIGSGLSSYKTGDLGIYLDRERIHYFGRRDFQINIRGYRVELGEIEYHLSKLPQVRSAAVIVTAQNTIIAFISVSEKGFEQEILLTTIRKQLELKLSQHMQPSAFVLLNEMPLNANGKLDRKALLNLNIEADHNQFIAPENYQEKVLVEVLSKELDLAAENISMSSSFFKIGGDSLSLLRVLKGLAKQGINKDIRQFYESHNLRELCEDKITSQSVLENSSIIKLNKSVEGIPLYLIHPITGRIDCYRQLADELSDICPIYGVQAPFLSGNDCNFSDIQQLADYYVEQIIANQPQGPYRVAGWSLGGRVAQKVIYNLSKAGYEIDYFAAFDTFMIHEEQINLTAHQALKKSFWVFVTELSETKSQAEKYRKIIKLLPEKMETLSIEQQINIVADLLLQQAYNSYLPNKEQIILALKYAVNLSTENRSLAAITIPVKSVLFIASENDNKELLKSGWQKAVLSDSIYVDIEGEHNSLLEGLSLEQIIARLRTDLMKSCKLRRSN